MALEKWLYESLDAGRGVESEIETILAGTRSVAFAGLLLCVGKKHPDLLTGPLRALVGVREFHLWDSVKHSEYHGINTGSFMDPELMRKLKWEWEQMPHRREKLHDLCCQLFLTKQESFPAFQRIRDLWLARARELAPGSEEALSWERWAAKFDRANYKENTKDGQTYWEFHLPEVLHDKAGERQFYDGQIYMQLPLWCRDVLDKRTVLPEAQLEQIWSSLQQISERQSPFGGDSEEELGNKLFHPSHSIAGLIAVLVALHREWLKRHPEREKWCREKVLALLREPPPYVSFDAREPVAHQSDGFLAEVVPVFWAEEPNSPEWRRHILFLALCPRLRTLALLCCASSRERSRLGTAFQDLQTFLLHFAAVRVRERRQQFSEAKPFNGKQWFDEWEKKFVEARMPAPPKSWLEIAVPDEIARCRREPHERDVPRRDFDLDLDFLLWAFSWISIPVDGADVLRAEWIHIEREALNCVIRTFPSVGKDEKYAGTPYDIDRQVFDRVAAVLLQLREIEQPQDFWKPILNFGAAAHYWVEDFLNSFFSVGLRDLPAPPIFQQRWRDMMDYAFASDEWSGDRFRLCELWHHLLGQDWVIRSLWVKEHESLLRDVKPYYERWAKERLTNPHELRIFFHFLETDAAQFLVCDALDWIAPLLKNADQWFWHREEDRDSFASFLSFAWDKHWLALKRNPAALEGFKTLTAKLAAHQNRLALEISSRVATLV